MFPSLPYKFCWFVIEFPMGFLCTFNLISNTFKIKYYNVQKPYNLSMKQNNVGNYTEQS